MISETILLAFSKRFGAMSSANILLETSRAKTISTPSLLTVFNSVPIFGLTNAIVEKKINNIKKSSLILGLNKTFKNCRSENPF